MRLLLDECLPRLLTDLLRAAGHDCRHVYDAGLGGQPDEAIMAAAAEDQRILLPADTDFGEPLANSPVLAPSVIQLRRTDKTADALAAVLIANLDQVAEDLQDGVIVVITETRVRARRLPITP